MNSSASLAWGRLRGGSASPGTPNSAPATYSGWASGQGAWGNFDPNAFTYGAGTGGAGIITHDTGGGGGAGAGAWVDAAGNLFNAVGGIASAVGQSKAAKAQAEMSMAQLKAAQLQAQAQANAAMLGFQSQQGQAQAQQQRTTILVSGVVLTAVVIGGAAILFARQRSKR